MTLTLHRVASGGALHPLYARGHRQTQSTSLGHANVINTSHRVSRLAQELAAAAAAAAEKKRKKQTKIESVVSGSRRPVSSLDPRDRLLLPAAVD